MKIYQVGGAVRDLFLNRTSNDIDYLVVGATSKEFLNKFCDASLVGKDFPVYLAKNENGIKCEYAFARKERKNGNGHKGFICEFDSSITLENDLSRRDLTINAIALSENGDIIDPYNGMLDLENKVLRHTSDVFSEDSLRVYRLARFYSQLDGFKVHNSTLKVLSGMNNQLADLPAERVWKEFEKALKSSFPEKFIKLLKITNCLNVHFEEFSGKELKTNQVDPILQFCELIKDFTYKEFHSFCNRLKIPNVYVKSGLATITHLKRAKDLMNLFNNQIITILLSSDNFVGGSDNFFKLVENSNKDYYFKIKDCINVKLPKNKRNLGLESGKWVEKMMLEKLQKLQKDL
jgi:tRNA nucleotidyltransferase (CCA-adding enzyme)